MKKRNKLSNITILITLVFMGSFSTYFIFKVIAYLFGTVLGISFISDMAGIAEAVAAIVGATLIVYQLDQDRSVEIRENNIQEAEFVLTVNKMFIENKEMSYVESNLENHFNGKIDLNEVAKEEDAQKYINYLVYLEGLAPLIIKGILTFDNIDNLLAYRYFIAANNTYLQKKELVPYGNYYKGIFKVYKLWRDYRVETYCNDLHNEKYSEVIPLVDNELDQLECFGRFSDSKSMIKDKLKCKQLSNDMNLSNTELYDIAKLIYATDPYIYPAMFPSRSVALEVIVHLLRSKKDKMFSLDNIFILQAGKEIVGLVLWHKGSLDWSLDFFKKTCEEKKFGVSEYIDKVYDDYILSYKKEIQSNIIDIINVAIKNEYRRMGLGMKLMSEFVKKHEKEDMELIVLKDNTSANKVYKENGFVIVEEGKGFNVISTPPDVYKMDRKAKQQSL